MEILALEKAITKMKNSLKVFYIRREMAEEEIRTHEDRLIEFIQPE